MAAATRTILVDDLDGSRDDVHTVRFSLDGTDFEVDLSADNEARLRDKLTKFVDNETPVRPPRGRTGKPSQVSRPPACDPDQTRAIRAWAAATDAGSPHAVASLRRSRMRSPQLPDRPCRPALAERAAHHVAGIRSSGAAAESHCAYDGKLRSLALREASATTYRRPS